MLLVKNGNTAVDAAFREVVKATIVAYYSECENALKWSAAVADLVIPQIITHIDLCVDVYGKFPKEYRKAIHAALASSYVEFSKIPMSYRISMKHYAMATGIHREFHGWLKNYAGGVVRATEKAAARDLVRRQRQKTGK